MSLLQPLWLLLALAGVVILLLHVRRRRSLDVSSIELWRRLASDQSTHRALRPPKPSWPLALQLLALLLLVLALARPVLGDGRTAEHWLVLVDASGSMLATDPGGEERFALAREELERSLAATQLGRGRTVSLLRVGADTRWLGARLDSAAESRAALSRLAPGEGVADWPLAAATLSAALLPDESVRVTVLTDPGGLESARTALEAALPGAPLELRAFGSPAENAALRRVEFTVLDPAAGRWRVTGEAALFGEAELRIEAWFAPGGVDDALPWGDAPLRFVDGVAEFDLDLELPVPGLLELRLPDDALAYDNRRLAWLTAAPEVVRVLHVGPENPALVRALQAVGGLEVFEADTLPADSATFDLVIVDRISTRNPGTDTLWLAGPSLATEASPPLLEPRASGWDDSHPLSSSVDWGGVDVRVGYRVPRLPGATVLFEANGFPLVQARDTGVGREVVVAFDLATSSWPDELGFPVFVANLVRWVDPLAGSPLVTTCRSAAPCPLDPALLWAGVVPTSLTVPGGAEEAAVSLPVPFVRPADGAGPAQSWTIPEAVGSWRPQRSGLYRLGEGGPLVVVDPMYSAESDLRSAVASTTATDPTAWAAWPVLRWLLLLALVVLLAEAWLAGRGQDRFLRGPSLQRDNPLAGRRRLILALRVATLLLLLLALVDVPLARLTREQHTVLLVDDPAFYGAEAGALLERVVAEARAESGRGRRLDVVRLGAVPRLDTGTDGAEGAVAGSDLAAALEFGSALLGTGDDGRLLLVAAGVETRGDLSGALMELRRRGVAVDALPLPGLPPGEVSVERLTLPPRLTAGESFTMHAVLRSEGQTPATVRVWREEELLDTLEVELSPGRNLIAVDLDEPESGRFLYRVEVEAPGDPFAQNDRAGVVAAIDSGARVLMVTPQPGAGETMAAALGLQGIEAEVIAPANAPYDVEGLLGYDAAILMNVPAIDLHTLQQQVFDSWVRDHGGGLLLLGGENTFGPGGYYQTPLEQLSPLSSRVPEEAPRVAMLFVLDRSGSMQQRVGDVTRLDIAKRATIDAAALLHPESVAGVVVFDEVATTLLPLVEVGEGAALQAALARLVAGGGTSIEPALALAYREFASIEAEARHIVLMTDGLSQPADFAPVLARLSGDDITISTVAISSGADRNRLQEIARLGGGTFHNTSDVRALPSILAQEALLLSSSPVEEIAFTPRWQSRDAAFLAGLPDALPPLGGYVRTSAKPEADVHLLGPDDDPLLASWRHGLGRVVAFASHGAGSWSRLWTADPLFPLLWAQAVRWALPPVKHPGLHLMLERRGDEVRVTLEAIDEAGAPAAGLRPAAAVSRDGEPVAAIALVAEGAGRYRAGFVANEPGRYRVEVALEEPRPPFEAVDAELLVSYPARYAFGAQGGDVLQVLVSASGGRALLGDEPLLAPAGRLRWLRMAGWPWWVVVAVALLLLELVLRYAPNALSFGVRSAPGASGGVRWPRRGRTS